MTNGNRWNSKATFIFSILSATFGMGSIWRLSYVIYSNGGGSFFIPYIIAILVMGIPFLILEYGLGFSLKDTFSNIVEKINPKFEVISWMVMLAVFMVFLYYVVIVGWDLMYLISSFTFQWGSSPAQFFVHNIGGSSDLSESFYFMIPTAISILIIWAIVWHISHKDLNDGIGKFSSVMVPLLLVTLSVIVIYAVTLPGAGLGISTLLTPDWKTLANVDIWIAAFCQIIFSLNLGVGLGITFSSYLPKGYKLIDSVLLLVFLNSLFEIFSSLGVFSILGYMSSTTGIPLTQLVSEQTGLMFVVFPKIFNVMGPAGRIMAPLLFITIMFAGIGSTVGGLEPFINSLIDKLDWSRSRAVTWTCAVGFIGSAMFATNIGSYTLRLVDIFLNEFTLLILIAAQCIIFTWIFDAESLIPVLNDNSTFNVGRFWKYTVKYILPLLLIVIWILGIDEFIAKTNTFEFTLYVILTAILVASSVILTKIKSRE